MQAHGALHYSVTFYASSMPNPKEKYIHQAFTADNLGLSEHLYPVRTLQRRYNHLRHFLLPPVDRALPLLLIGSDMPHLLTPIKPVQLGPLGGPIAVHTKLGWSLQGPTSIDQVTAIQQQCLFMSTITPTFEFFKNVERLWQVDMPYTNEKQVTRSKQDQQALRLLQTSTDRVDVEGIRRYATPLLTPLPPFELLRKQCYRVFVALREYSPKTYSILRSIVRRSRNWRRWDR